VGPWCARRPPLAPILVLPDGEGGRVDLSLRIRRSVVGEGRGQRRSRKLTPRQLPVPTQGKRGSGGFAPNTALTAECS
jgi:hypothetical protein